MAHVVVLGGGVGGVTAAYEYAGIRRPDDRITLISDQPSFSFTPSNPWVAVGWRQPDEILVPLQPTLDRLRIDFVPTAASRVDPERSRIELADGGVVDYDFLIIATGPQLAFDEVEGLGPQGNTHSICTTPHAAEAAEGWKRFLEDPGPVIIGAAQGASCFGPAYEFAFILDAELRKRRMRDRVPISFVTSEPYIGHLGLAGVGDSKGMLESELRQHHINWITNARVESVEPARMRVTELDEEAREKKRHELEFRYAMMLPAFRGIEAVQGIEGLVNPRGFVLIDRYQRNPKYENIYAVGVCVAIPPIEPTPVPTGVPKTGYMIETMALAAAENIRAVLDGRKPEAVPTWNAICLADMGDTGIAFVAMPEMPPRNVNWMRKGRWVHFAKVAFERYFLRKVRRGITENIFEKYMLKTLGIDKIKAS